MDNLLHKIEFQMQSIANQDGHDRVTKEAMICGIARRGNYKTAMLALVLVTSLIPIITGAFGFIVAVNLKKTQTEKYSIHKSGCLLYFFLFIGRPVLMAVLQCIRIQMISLV